MRKLISIIFVVVISLGFNLQGFTQTQDSSSDDTYSKDLYGSEVEKPQTYDSGDNLYDGVTSVEGIKRMMEDIKRLNEMQTFKEKNKEINLIETSLELSNLSEAFGTSISLRAMETEEENAVPERQVAMQEVAETIVEELEGLRRAGKLPLVYMTEEEAAVSGEDSQGKSSISGSSGKTGSEKVEESGAEIYEKEVEFEEGAVTISYLIFGKRVIIDIPLLRSAEGFEARMEALERQLQHMATLLEEMGRQK